MRAPAVVYVFAVALVAYALLAAAAQWWLSALAATLVAGLLWRRHRRARFAAYVWLSVVAVRGVLLGPWAVTVFAIAMILALQLPAAVAAWPRLDPAGRRRPAHPAPPGAPPGGAPGVIE